MGVADHLLECWTWNAGGSHPAGAGTEPANGIRHGPRPLGRPVADAEWPCRRR